MMKATLIRALRFVGAFCFAGPLVSSCSEPEYDELLVQICREILEDVASNPTDMRIVRFYFVALQPATERVEFHFDDVNQFGATLRRTLLCSFQSDSLDQLIVDQELIPERQANLMSVLANSRLVSENYVGGFWCQVTGLCVP